MKEIILHPVGRAEPDDVRGWLEHGGALGLQLAFQLTPAELRARLSHIKRRDGRGLLKTTPVPDAAVTIDFSNPIQRYLATELPTFIIEGALIWARACEAATAILLMQPDTPAELLWNDILAQLSQLGITSDTGWTGIAVRQSIPMEQGAAPITISAPDALTTRLIPLVLWEHADPPVTLIQTTGKFKTASLFEIPLGLTVRDFVYNWAGGLPSHGTLWLGNRMLTRAEWGLPLTYELWGEDLGWGILECR